MQLVDSRGRAAIQRSNAGRSKGFTLIELMVTIAVAAILLAIATPSFTSLINSSRLTSSANEMVATLQTARMEAVRRNTRINVCAGCDGNANSLVAFVDANSNGNVDAGESIRVATINRAVQLSGGTDVVFFSTGLGRAASAPNGALLETAFRFCIPTTQPAENVRVVNIASGSRISTDRANGGGACP
ncbi:GspH/FimT family pseudopilin [Novilysobacter antarcticus]|uniref:GspH/FimT family pseudopilin n=1 Tax=Novilysobacter antarcticus TaxID=2862543 RepID=UPI001C992EB4|nr:GspH/FimT family pseudopilin [Lysobacter antarcticus]